MFISIVFIRVRIVQLMHFHVFFCNLKLGIIYSEQVWLQ